MPHGKLEPLLFGDGGLRKDLAQAFHFGRVMAGNQNLVACGNSVELGLNLGQVAGKVFHRLDPEMAGGFQRVCGTGGKGDGWSFQERGECGIDREDPGPVFESGQVVLGFFPEVGRLHEHDPGSLGEIGGQMAKIFGVRQVEWW